ncbi:MAG: hypothetical protein IIU21_02140, partial [Schwartzia sp.]|nr:hypothetical protein [Schwartzia sp. (in: firmicutes)]
MHSMLTLDIAHQLDGTELIAEGRVLTAPLSRESYQKAEITLSVGGRTISTTTNPTARKRTMWKNIEDCT